MIRSLPSRFLSSYTAGKYVNGGEKEKASWRDWLHLSCGATLSGTAHYINKNAASQAAAPLEILFIYGMCERKMVTVCRGCKLFLSSSEIVALSRKMHNQLPEGRVRALHTSECSLWKVEHVVDANQMTFLPRWLHYVGFLRDTPALMLVMVNSIFLQ